MKILKLLAKLLQSVICHANKALLSGVHPLLTVPMHCCSGLLILTMGVAGLGLAAAIGYAPATEQLDSQALKADKDPEAGVSSLEAPTAQSWPPEEGQPQLWRRPISAGQCGVL